MPQNKCCCALYRLCKHEECHLWIAFKHGQHIKYIPTHSITGPLAAKRIVWMRFSVIAWRNWKKQHLLYGLGLGRNSHCHVSIRSSFCTDTDDGDSRKNNDYSGIAKSLLHIPVTSAPGKRAFSVAGDIVTATRKCLTPDIVDMLVFLKQNLGTGTDDYTFIITYQNSGTDCVLSNF